MTTTKRFNLHAIDRGNNDFGGSFGMPTREGLILAGRIAEATLTGPRARIAYVGDDDTLGFIEGVVRHVVSAESDGFADLPWSPQDRLRISDMLESFIPLAKIVNITVLSS